jgi:hypothetical protein
MKTRERLPILDWMPSHRKQWLRPDVIAGLTVVALLIPEEMSDDQLAGTYRSGVTRSEIRSGRGNIALEEFHG